MMGVLLKILNVKQKSLYSIPREWWRWGPKNRYVKLNQN